MISKPFRPDVKATAAVAAAAVVGILALTSISKSPVVAPVSPAVERVGYLPDPRITPGDVVAVTEKEVCVAGYTAHVRNVTQEMKDEVYRRYGMDPAHHVPCEVDHLISLELGGSNSYLNLFPQPYAGKWGARVKDKLENYLHRRVCAGKETLQEAQEEIRSDWTVAYRKYFGEPADPPKDPSTPTEEGKP